MKTYSVTFQRTVLVEVEDAANLSQIKAAAVERYNDPPSFEEMYIGESGITSICEEVFKVG